MFIALRNKFISLRRGKFLDLGVTDNSFVFARRSEAQTAIVILNNGTRSEKVHVTYAASGDFTGQLGNAATLSIRNGEGRVEMPAHSAEIFIMAR